MKLITNICNIKLQIILLCFLAALAYSIFVTFYFSKCKEAEVTVRNIQRNLLILTDITDDSVEPKNDQNIFFIDTFRMQPKYKQRKAMNIGKRQACAIESAALLNPHLNIYAAYITREKRPKLRLTPELQALIQYPNLKFVSINHNSFPIGSPLGTFFINNDEIMKSEFVIVHMSDAYRLLILWKYGGLYYDTDVISLKTAENMPQNFACDDGEGDIVANGIMRFDRHKGRNLTEMFIKYMIDNYNADEWGTNGPIVITKILRDICKTESIKEMVLMENCDGFHVLPRKICYPIPWSKWKGIFNENRADKMMKLINESMTLHLWNNLSKRKRIDFGEDNLFNRIAKEKCPNVFKVMNHEI
ncbi:lactosylceramide 4-alpha-galactosyltransferase-like [Chironomus tepperi]|uniref:lactosylceramide 4-alpha-galactosyltransferase-like n=1 Tax=Chironomus tepperi TaxID=113505 RepID=UPI00391F5F88